MPRPRILLADDHTLLAEAFKLVLETEFDVVGTVGDGHSLLRAVQTLRPDVVLLDLFMPYMDGLEAGQKLKSSYPDVKIIVLSVCDNAKTAAECLNSWASGYLLKRSMGTELVSAIKDVVRGIKYITPILEKEIAEVNLVGLRPAALQALTSRQRDVLRLLASGCTMKEAAAALHLATRTVAFHKYRIMQDFGLENNSDLLRFAMKQRVVQQA